MSKFINETPCTHVYPGHTWEQEAAASGWTVDSLFSFSVHRKITKDKCDCCMKANKLEHHFCSKKCYDDLTDECRREAEWEARVS